MEPDTDRDSLSLHQESSEDEDSEIHKELEHQFRVNRGLAEQVYKLEEQLKRTRLDLERDVLEERNAEA